MHIPLELVNELLARWRSWAVFKGLVAQPMPRGTCQIPYVTCAVHSNKLWCSWQRPVYYWGFVVTPWSERLSSYRSGTVSLPFHGYNIKSLCCQQIAQCVRRVLFCRKLWGRNKQPVTVALEGNVDGNWNRGQKILKTCIKTFQLRCENSNTCTA